MSRKSSPTLMLGYFLRLRPYSSMSLKLGDGTQIGADQVVVLVRIAAQVVDHRKLRLDIGLFDARRATEDRLIDFPFDRHQPAVLAEEHIAMAAGRIAVTQHEGRGVNAVDRAILGHEVRCADHPGQGGQPVCRTMPWHSHRRRGVRQWGIPRVTTPPPPDRLNRRSRFPSESNIAW